MLSLETMLFLEINFVFPICQKYIYLEKHN